MSPGRALIRLGQETFGDPRIRLGRETFGDQKEQVGQGALLVIEYRQDSLTALAGP